MIIIKYLKYYIFIVFFISCTNEQVYKSSKTKIIPDIDGIMDNFWQSSKRELINGDMCGVEWDGANDFSVFFRSLWDNNNVYFFIEVIDDKLVKNYDPIVPWFENDIVEIFFTKKRKWKGAENAQFAFMYGVDSMFMPPLNKSSDKVVYCLNDTKTGYNIEVLIPWSEIDIEPKKNKSIIFNIEASDCDKKSEEQGVFYGRDISVSWSSKSCRRTWQDTRHIGELKLTDD